MDSAIPEQGDANMEDDGAQAEQPDADMGFLGILVDMNFLANVFPGILLKMKDDATARRFSWSATWTRAPTRR